MERAEVEEKEDLEGKQEDLALGRVSAVVAAAVGRGREKGMLVIASIAGRWDTNEANRGVRWQGGRRWN